MEKVDLRAHKSLRILLGIV